LNLLEAESSSCRQYKDPLSVEQASTNQIAHSALHGVPLREIARFTGLLADYLRDSDLSRMLSKDEGKYGALGLCILLGGGGGIA
jgi:hypothetical protein